ncbi:MAG: protein kinase family protein [Desulfobacterales bacterium]|nr:protein kinase family protein [Desulfobacterales bacterium]
MEPFLDDNGKIYNPLEVIGRGECAEIIKAKDSGCDYVVIKKFNSNARANPRGRRKTNHTGKLREANPLVFKELKEISDKNDCLVRIISKGKTSQYEHFILMEYIKGKNLEDYLNDQIIEENNKLISCFEFGKALRTLHLNDIAHGDPHLANVMIKSEKNTIGAVRVKFVDLNMLHSPKFVYCRKFNCFDSLNVLKQDLKNNLEYIGKGFIRCLEDFNYAYAEEFLKGYNYLY